MSFGPSSNRWPRTPSRRGIGSCKGRAASQLLRFSDACGAEVPRWIRTRLQALGDDVDGIRAFGLDAVTALCERLIAGGAPGLHFYTMNQSPLVLEIAQRLGLHPSAPAAPTMPAA